MAEELYLGIGEDFNFLFTSRTQYHWEEGNELFTYQDVLYLNNYPIEIIKYNINHFKAIYHLLNVNSLCTGDCEIIKL